MIRLFFFFFFFFLGEEERAVSDAETEAKQPTTPTWESCGCHETRSLSGSKHSVTPQIVLEINFLSIKISLNMVRGYQGQHNRQVSNSSLIANCIVILVYL